MPGIAEGGICGAARPAPGGRFILLTGHSATAQPPGRLSGGFRPCAGSRRTGNRSSTCASCPPGALGSIPQHVAEVHVSVSGLHVPQRPAQRPQLLELRHVGADRGISPSMSGTGSRSRSCGPRSPTRSSTPRPPTANESMTQDISGSLLTSERVRGMPGSSGMT